MSTEEKTAYDLVGDILERELGERWGDGYVVIDVMSGYSEPGYTHDDVVVVMGNWNPKRWVREGDEPLTEDENIGPRLADIFEEMDGVEIEWYDEWFGCSNCYRAVRAVGNSYSWRPSFAWVSDCEPVCEACLRLDANGYITDPDLDYVNNPEKCVTWADALDMVGWGWTQWEPGDEQVYESGWHPGQTDDPKKILEAILEHDEDARVVFLLDESSQFYVRFSAWLAPENDDGE